MGNKDKAFKVIREDLIKQGYPPKIEIPIKYIIELGMLRKRNRCAKCNKEMDVPNHNIQLCFKCRDEELTKYAIEKYAEVLK